VYFFNMTVQGTEDPSGNNLYGLYLAGGANLAYTAEHGAGVNIDAVFGPVSLKGHVVQLVLTRDALGRVAAYCNGRKVSDLVTPTDAGGGGVILPDTVAPAQELVLGKGLVAGTLIWMGMKITTAKYTDAQVQESYRRTFFGKS
jgi:hypothetical protein